MKHSEMRVALWIDHEQARVVNIPPSRTDAPMFGAQGQDTHTKNRGTPEGGHERRNARRFFRRIERSIEHAGQILVLGPSTAKLEFVRYLRKHAHAIERRVVGIETMAQATDAQLNTFTQEYFPSIRQDDDLERLS